MKSFLSMKQEFIDFHEDQANEIMEAIDQAGYQHTFEIALEKRSDFLNKIPGIDRDDLAKIHQLAVQRADQLKLLRQAWQVRQDPMIKAIPKLSSKTGITTMQQTLNKSLGGGSQFNDLFPERSPEGYVEASSIQSLFSPGRYLTCLYKIARQLHDKEDVMHIDKRRPDLGSLVLSTNNMNDPVSTLDLLLELLDPDGHHVSSLEDRYYPMTLPYHDDLKMIHASVEAKGLTINDIWNRLHDEERQTFFHHLSDPLAEKSSIRERLQLTPNLYQLLMNQDPDQLDIARHYNVSQTATMEEMVSILNDVNAFCLKTNLTFQALLDLTAQLDYREQSNKKMVTKRHKGG